jgi:hypothetical protein
VAGSGSGDADVPSTPATEVPAKDGTSAPSVSAAQEGVDNYELMLVIIEDPVFVRMLVVKLNTAATNITI